MDHGLVVVKGLGQLNEVMAMACRATQDRQVTVESSDKMWSTGRNGNSLQYSCLKNPMNSMKRQKDMTPEDEP